MAPKDARWQRLPRARRAAVYRAIGRAARAAREDVDREVAADVRIAIDLLRGRAHAPRAPAAATRPRKGRPATRPARR